MLLNTAFGVPEMTHVVALMLAQPGNAVAPDFIPHALIAAPLVARVVGVTDMAEPKVTLVPVAPE